VGFASLFLFRQKEKITAENAGNAEAKIKKQDRFLLPQE